MNFFKRTVPMLITAVVGFVLIIAFFIPVSVDWGETVTVWFDILAAAAFILGGGNLLKVQLKKISDQAAGWGYALVTLIAFLATLAAGLFKLGAPPAANQEFYGQVFVTFALEDLPESQTFRVAGEIPHRKHDDELPASVRRQLSEENGELVFKGWIRKNQVDDLKDYNTTLKWLATVEELEEKAQPPKVLKGKIDYLSDHSVLALKGVMTRAQKTALSEMKGGPVWDTAVAKLEELSQNTVQVEVEPPPDFEIPKSLKQKVPEDKPGDEEDDEPEKKKEPEDPGVTVAVFDANAKTLEFKGPMSTDQRDLLLNQFPIATPLTDEERTELRTKLESASGTLSETQAAEFEKVLDGLWTIDQLVAAIDAGGVYEAKAKTAAELLKEKTEPLAGVAQKPDRKLSPAQIDALKAGLTPAPPQKLAKEIEEKLNEARPANAPELNSGQKKAIEKFLGSQPTIGQRNEAIYFALLKNGPVSPEQKTFLLAAIQAEMAWQKQIVGLFQDAHQVKYAWSGAFNEQGTVFWWLYEYLFKPLTATMFSLLAFYVASAAFRAFRAKNLEATLLLGTAFIILLGRTFAGVLLTGWMPDELSGLRIENLAVYIMKVFNTAGNRAIMIGIALGIASTSLKVLLGIDRSYLGSQED